MKPTNVNIERQAHMATRSFIDTNILLYAEASDKTEKQQTALDLLHQHYQDACAVISTQVLQEYCNIAIKKLKLEPQYIRSQLDFYLQFEVIQVTADIIRIGFDIHQTRSMAFFDAIIVASAKTAGCSVLFSEDMNAGELIDGIQIINPFSKQHIRKLKR